MPASAPSGGRSAGPDGPAAPTNTSLAAHSRYGTKAMRDCFVYIVTPGQTTSCRLPASTYLPGMVTLHCLFGRSRSAISSSPYLRDAPPCCRPLDAPTIAKLARPDSNRHRAFGSGTGVIETVMSKSAWLFETE